jgi:xanthine dehydrogenase small subunit
MTVLDWLRAYARLTGTKEGCGEGDCGACTIVLGRNVDGRMQYQAVNSCLMMLPQIHECAVLTVEGLAGPDGELHSVQEALVETDATQCGFCTPGFVMAMFAFHHGGEPAHDHLIHEALAGNLCRCTGYRPIIAACRRIAGGPADRFVPQAQQILDALSALQSADAPKRAVDNATAEYCANGQVFVQPHSLAELYAEMMRFPEAILLAGGTDLGLRASKGREAIPVVISTAAISELQQVAVGPDALEFGAAVTYTEILPHLDRHFPAFAALVRRIGSRQIRNLGTISGNLATASPIGDTIPCLIALRATVCLRSLAGERVLAVESLIAGYRKTALLPNEVIATIRIPLLRPGQVFSVYKLSKRFDQDISTVIAAFLLHWNDGIVLDFRAAYGGMAPRAMRASNLEWMIQSRAWAEMPLAEIGAALARDFNPITDHRGSAGYRLRAAANLVRRFQLETSSDVRVRVEAL